MLLRTALLSCFCLLMIGGNVSPAAAQQTPGTTAPPPTLPTTVVAPARKSNARPREAQSPVSAVEPFDAATVTKMAESCVTLETEAGQIEIEMLPGAAPETVRNFLNLTATGFFDTTTFSRVVKSFVVQGGNVTTRPNLTEDLLRRASRTIVDEPNSVKHERGIVSMARAAAPNSTTTHFFILVGAAPHLNNMFAAFGRVVSGMEAVDAINGAPLKGEEPETPVRVKRAAITRCPVTVAPPAAATPQPPAQPATPSASSAPPAPSTPPAAPTPAPTAIP